MYDMENTFPLNPSDYTLTQWKMFLSTERTNYRFFFFAKITFQLSL
jgi:hypothetical protein